VASGIPIGKHGTFPKVMNGQNGHINTGNFHSRSPLLDALGKGTVPASSMPTFSLVPVKVYYE